MKNRTSKPEASKQPGNFIQDIEAILLVTSSFFQFDFFHGLHDSIHLQEYGSEVKKAIAPSSATQENCTYQLYTANGNHPVDITFACTDGVRLSVKPIRERLRTKIMKDLEQQLKDYSGKGLQQRKHWYSQVADAYNRVRPHYPKQLINHVVELAKLRTDALILEVGCGPGTATTAFAQLGFSMICLEPSPEACQLARQNCSPYPHVEIRNTSFEEWELEPERFNAVLAATSFHWVSPEIGYPKAATALKDNGSLILLWNTALEPNDEVYQALHEVYQTQVPSLAQFHEEQRGTLPEFLRRFGKMEVNSGQFKNLVSEQLVCEVTYSINDYLELLSTYSPYIALDEQKRDSLFEGLREVLERNCTESIQTSYLSAFQIAQKI